MLILGGFGAGRGKVVIGITREVIAVMPEAGGCADQGSSLSPGGMMPLRHASAAAWVRSSTLSLLRIALT